MEDSTTPERQNSKRAIRKLPFRFGPKETHAGFGSQVLGAFSLSMANGKDMDTTTEDKSSSSKSNTTSPSERSGSVSSCEIIVATPTTFGGFMKGSGRSNVNGNAVELSGTDRTDPLPKGWENDRKIHNDLFSSTGANSQAKVQNAHLEEIKTTPLFSAKVLLATIQASARLGEEATFPSYGLLAERLATYRSDSSYTAGENGDHLTVQDDRLFLNTNAPWSTFICGSQGSGKSHTLSCILEDALLQTPRLGKQPKQLAGLVFHYDKFTGFSSSQMCEAAYLCSKGIRVNVLVSPSNFWIMSKLYENLPGLAAGVGPNVAPLFLEPMQLNVERIMKLMAFDNNKEGIPLYMEVVCRILRQMAIENQGAPGLDYETFKKRLSFEVFNPAQKAMIELRLQLLENFMQLNATPGVAYVPPTKPKFKNTPCGKQAARDWYNKQDQMRKASIAKQGIWSFPPGSLTIVDLSCPFIDESAACALFNMCLSIFLDDRQDVGRIIALDEAHKFMSENSNASTLTETLLSVIRQQRHLATRVVIATQEPTISPKLLDLSSMTIVHRFSSPSWLETLKAHLAGASRLDENAERNVQEIFKTIVTLEAGQALLFSPSAMMDAEVSVNASGNRSLKAHKLGMGYIKIGVRKRLTADGGRSIMAT